MQIEDTESLQRKSQTAQLSKSKTILRVALDVPLDQLFDYLPLENEPLPKIGQLVEVPFGSRKLRGVVLKISHTSETPPEKIKRIHGVVDWPTSVLPIAYLSFIEFAASYYHYPIGEVLALALPLGVRRGGATVTKSEVWYGLTDNSEQTDAYLAALPARSAKRKLLSSLVESGRPVLRNELLRQTTRAAASIAALLQDGIVREYVSPRMIAIHPGPTLTAAQQQAVAAIGEAAGRFAPLVLHGVTGSGKTEVYLQAIASAVSRGGQVLIMVPEIFLAMQLEAIMRARFSDLRLGCVHSLATPTHRVTVFHQGLAGDIDVVLGTRLAVWAPLPRLALVIVDEEHDAAYKQEDRLRYSARDLAIYRGQQAATPVLLGSATPSLESWHKAALGRYGHLSLPQRVNTRPLPQMRCIDLRQQQVHDGLSDALLQALDQRLAAKEMSLVFINRRGYAPALQCSACAWVSPCPHCSATLVLHLAAKDLRCHHCGYSEASPRACPECGNQDLLPLGRGTQRVEEALGEKLPQARLLRVDRDIVSTKGKWAQAVAAISNNEVDILVGTQLLAKGHDFPALTLVGVVNADASLYSSDFRAKERLFAQLLQVGGRSGRGDRPGTTLIQTRYPQHPLFAALAHHDFASFANAQLLERQEVGFPPYAHQALLIAQSNDMQHTLTFLQGARKIAVQLIPPEIMIYDVVPMRLQRLASKERAQLLVSSRNRPLLQQFLTRWLAALRAQRQRRDLHWALDVDPQEL